MTYSETNNVHQFTFSGSGGEYFKIWIVNILLSILTLGIYSAWAKVRNHRYFYGNTYLDGSSFEYHATGWQILKGRIIAFVFLVIYVLAGQFFPIFAITLPVLLMFILPLVVWSAIRFNARMSSYRNVKFGFKGSKSEIYKYLLFIPMIPLALAAILATLAFTDEMPQLIPVAVLVAVGGGYLIVPWTQALFTSYFLRYSKYGQGEFDAELNAGEYYKIYTKAFVLGMIGTILISIIIGAVGMSLMPAQPDVIGMQNGDKAAIQQFLISAGPMLFVFYLLMFSLGLFVKSYVNVSVRNYMFSQLSFDSRAEFEADYSVKKLFNIQMINMFLLISTMGLAYPWIKVRLAAYSADGLSFAIDENLDGYINSLQEKQNALGDEMGEAFDVDTDVGLVF